MITIRSLEHWDELLQRLDAMARLGLVCLAGWACMQGLSWLLQPTFPLSGATPFAHIAPAAPTPISLPELPVGSEPSVVVSAH